ncbi:MAG: nitroreductase family protein [Synergistales bacterium]|nr:nitroreductase family protein [Synergistales bacterium]
MDDNRERKFMPLPDYQEYSIQDMKIRSEEFYTEIRGRRSVRHFSDRPVPRDIIEECLKAAATAPSGANKQPWYFVVVTDKELKKRIRELSEAGEKVFYARHSSLAWGKALKDLATNAQKPFLEIAPYLIVIFSQPYGISPEGEKIPHYFVNQSVGIATGILISAIRHAGLACLTYTPSDPHFLNGMLSRPAHEKPFMILVTGYPAQSAEVPVLRKKEWEEIVSFM